MPSSALARRICDFTRSSKSRMLRSCFTSFATRPAAAKLTQPAGSSTPGCPRKAAWCSISTRPSIRPALSRPTPPARCRRRKIAYRCGLRPAKRNTIKFDSDCGHPHNSSARLGVSVKQEETMRNTKLPIILGVAAALAFSTLALAGRHPHYLRARTDLRTAQFLMRVHDEDNVMRHLREADAEIDRAVREIDRAAVIDHKDLEDHPSIDRSLDRRGRFHKADRKSTRLNSSHLGISYAVFCLKKKK